MSAPNPYGERLLMVGLCSGISCAYTSGMETNTTFTANNTIFKIVQIKTHSDQFTAQLGWTHFAEVKRANGRKSYFANLLMVDGTLVDTKIVGL